MQSKVLFGRVPPRATRPNAAFERQIVPPVHQRINQLPYLPYGIRAGNKKGGKTEHLEGFAYRQPGVKAYAFKSITP
ncbi:hypothetical protein [Pedobacter sp. ASV28]|uniref:hypothetical protein n=1 Tax=Pedobacter sp. ASV28 TaxID=2795123 RepID=UPI0018ED8EAF|nr:hypothetical protein [Pedobacter sp. ASV28]